MIQYEVTIHLNRPVEQVFAFLMDTTQLTTWQTNLIKIDKITEGPFRMGSRFQEVRRLGRKESKIQGEITAFELNKRFETKTLTKPQVIVSYLLEPDEGGTRVKHKFVMLTSGFLRLLEPMIAKSIREENGLDFENLKRVLEN
jgi:uncharacterized protein YndB with AHSA1/START domain